VRAPFSPADAVNMVLMPLCKTYNIHRITGDNYAGEYPKELVRTSGISYDLAAKHKSALYADPFLSLLNSRKIDLPRNERAINQICSLERSVQRSGRDQISHSIHGRDDLANSIAGAADLAYSTIGYDVTQSAWQPGFVDRDALAESAHEPTAVERASQNAADYVRMYARMNGLII
jgi:hypothetical protein